MFLLCGRCHKSPDKMFRNEFRRHYLWSGSHRMVLSTQKKRHVDPEELEALLSRFVGEAKAKAEF